MKNAETEHKTRCWAAPKCERCFRTKAPYGRSVPLEAATGYCGFDCDGYFHDPKPGHFWPDEEPELKAAAVTFEAAQTNGAA